MAIHARRLYLAFSPDNTSFPAVSQWDALHYDEWENQYFVTQMELITDLAGAICKSSDAQLSGGR